MSSTISLTRASAPTDTARSFAVRVGRWIRRHPAVLFGAVVFLFWIVGTLLAPLLLPYGPTDQNISAGLQPPGIAHLWGTDKLGRDVLVRVLYGTRITLPAAFIAVLIDAAIGITIGALAGYLGGLWDEALMRLTDVFLAFPSIVLAMAIAAALGPSIINAIITIAVVSWPNYARVTRGLVLSVKTADYVEAAHAIGVRHWRILLRHVLPNCLGPLVAIATLDFGGAILLFAGLSFLGLGPTPDTPEWGRMVADGIEYSDQWWVSAFPGLAIFSVVLALNFLGDGLRDWLDPRTRR
ncbi:MAG: ABC transporter permease [Aggregatilineales bacterium]